MKERAINIAFVRFWYTLSFQGVRIFRRSLCNVIVSGMFDIRQGCRSGSVLCGRFPPDAFVFILDICRRRRCLCGCFPQDTIALILHIGRSRSVPKHCQPASIDMRRHSADMSPKTKLPTVHAPANHCSARNTKKIETQSVNARSEKNCV